MARTIDLKNKRQEAKPQTGQVNGEQFQRHNEPEKPWRPEQQPEQEIEGKAVPLFQPEPRIISWSGQLYYQPDVKLVVAVSVLFFVIAVLIQIFQKNLITTIFFALLGVVILLNAGKKSKVTEFEISPLGVKAYEKLYPYREIKSFWIEYDPSLGIEELSLQLKRWYLPYLKIPIEDQNPVQLRLSLLEFLPEIEHRDTFVEILSRRLGI